MSMQFNRQHPFFARIKERYSLCRPGSKKETHHIVLDLKGSGITYTVGDCLAVLPHNREEAVQKIMYALRARGDELVLDRQKQIIPLNKFLQEEANISEYSKKFVSELEKRQVNLNKKQALADLVQDREKLKAAQAKGDVAELLLQHQEIILTPQEFADLAMPLLPRFYSIASAMREVGEEVHLTVALVKQEEEALRLGVCSYYLCHDAPEQEAAIPVYIQPHKGFTLPKESEAAVIMVGPGTGVAPFRAFMQERVARGDTGKSWLFFGECHRELHFFYQDYWQNLEVNGFLRLALAFSRDQPEKFYVQHQMQHLAEEFFKWLEEGAYLYVCGDAKRMARDVEATLIKIIEQQKEGDPKDYLKKMRQKGRYLKDVY